MDNNDNDYDDHKHKASFPFTRLAFVKGAGAASDQGLRNENEDGFVFADGFLGLPWATIFGVYDGHGGKDCVEWLEEGISDDNVSAYGGRGLLSFIESEVANGLNKYERELSLRDSSNSGSSVSVSKEDCVCQALSTAFQLADQAFIRRNEPSGSTAVVCLTLIKENDGTT